MLTALLTFAGVALLATSIPGPDTAVVIKNSLGRGRRSALATAAGCSTGQIGWGLASIAGISAVLAASVVAFTVLKWIGALYLCYLGFRALLSAARKGEPVAASATASAGPARVLASYRDGLLTNSLNPKTALFMSALLPQFTNPGDPAWVPFALVAITAVVSFACMSAYALVFTKLGDVLRRPAVRRTVDGTLGGVLVSFGVGLAFSRQ
ncbi:LysE family translocator [Actinokineospora auranticolor]|uniref:Threonine/homoserine/homoserine lactone efflux protein n=1 Tax=Actinokineospora auranticolor TaxID=155976 RepID=A0A2S6GKC2_9PSEU|nr:LysE family translocator [Actinokineospora auranticolor]PPK65684.1 threonine/homoserine/homoserine lactone efflux protein [Actinokineospora auranticolor]